MSGLPRLVATHPQAAECGSDQLHEVLEYDWTFGDPSSGRRWLGIPFLREAFGLLGTDARRAEGGGETLGRLHPNGPAPNRNPNPEGLGRSKYTTTATQPGHASKEWLRYSLL